MEIALVSIALIAYLGFRQWLRHDRRSMVHRERLAALEKGAEMPALEQEIQRGNWNVQRILLLAGLCWISVGVGAFVVLSVLIAHAPPEQAPPQGIQWIGLALVGIGASHLAVYAVGRNRER
jgi:hypothetical protein